MTKESLRTELFRIKSWHDSYAHRISKPASQLAEHKPIGPKLSMLLEENQTVLDQIDLESGVTDLCKIFADCTNAIEIVRSAGYFYRTGSDIPNWQLTYKFIFAKYYGQFVSPHGHGNRYPGLSGLTNMDSSMQVNFLFDTNPGFDSETQESSNDPVLALRSRTGLLSYQKVIETRANEELSYHITESHSRDEGVYHSVRYIGPNENIFVTYPDIIFRDASSKSIPKAYAILFEKRLILGYEEYMNLKAKAI